jgi:hypothetical protein
MRSFYSITRNTGRGLALTTLAIVADSDRIQVLIGEARSRITTANEVSREGFSWFQQKI